MWQSGRILKIKLRNKLRKKNRMEDTKDQVRIRGITNRLMESWVDNRKGRY